MLNRIIIQIMKKMILIHLIYLKCFLRTAMEIQTIKEREKQEDKDNSNTIEMIKGEMFQDITEML